MIGRVILVLFFSATIIFISSEVWAQTLEFDQDTYIFEHNGFLTIIDTSTNAPSIEAQVTSSSDDVDVKLYKVDNNTYRSNLIHFSETAANLSGEYPVVNLDEEESILARYNGVESVSVPIERSSSSVNLSSDYSGPVDDFTMENYPTCNNFGEDDDGDYICNNWETGERIVRLNEVTSNYVLSPNCDPGIDYKDDPLGVKVCPYPDVKDIYVEIDYMKGHKPNVEALEKVVEAFRNAPIENESAVFPTGINLHIFIDEEINHADKIFFDTSDGGFFEMKAKQFGLESEKNSEGEWANIGDKAGKAQIFYYYLWAHSQAEDPGSSGRSEQNGNDGTVSLGHYIGMVGSLDQQAGTFMHEFGHNIGLNHGGGADDVDNCKPNLLSVMTYSRQFSDLIDRPLDYSREPVGTMQDTSSLGDEIDLKGRNPDVSKYDDCPAIFTIDNMDQDFDGITDLCDTQTSISSDITIDTDVTFGGDIIIEPSGVLTINSGKIMSFDSAKKILVESGGKLIVKSGGKIDGFSSVDIEPNQVMDHMEDSPMVFGDGGPAMVEHTHQGDIPWPSNWKDLRFIKDTEGNFVCPPPDLNDDGNEDDQDLELFSDNVELTSDDQWSLIDLSRGNAQWQSGRSTDSNDHHETSLKNSSEQNVFPVTSTISEIGIQKISLTNSAGTNEIPELGRDKVYTKQTHLTICHYPPEDPENPITTTVRAEEVESHFDHGDTLGMCEDKSDTVEIIIKSSSGDESLHPIDSSCHNCFFPSTVKIDVGTTVEWINLDWTQPHSVTSVFPNISDPVEKFDYAKGELDNHYFRDGQSFRHTFETPGTFQYSCIYHPWMKGTIHVGTGEIGGGDSGDFIWDGWCISREDALKQIKERPYLDINRAPVCNNPEKDEPEESTVENVRAARSVLVDNVLDLIEKLNPDTDVENSSDIVILKEDLQEIRQYVLEDNMPEALTAYVKFSNTVTVLVTSQTSEREILDELDRNIEVTKRNVPEFETLSILVLIISTIAIIAVSRKGSFNSISNHSI